MTTHAFVYLVSLLAVFGSSIAAQSGDSAAPRVVPRLLTSPLPSPQEIVMLEERLQQHPDDIDGRMALLRFYRDTAPVPPNENPARRSARLQHILYLIEHHPEAPATATSVAHVYRSDGIYANVADHEAARNLWLAVVQAHPGNSPLIVNASRFLAVEDKSDAEEVLRRAMAVNPENQEIAANLGFLYAMEILRLDSLVRRERPARHEPDLKVHALAELDVTSNAYVLAAAGTALPNLAVAEASGRPVDQDIFDLASKLSSKARQLAPADSDIRGPMPMIRYFSAVQQETGPSTQLGRPLIALPSAAGPLPTARIRIGASVQATKLVRKTAPEYPELAQRAGIAGDVQLAAVISPGGTVQSLEVLSGHPLLVASALQAVKTWIYKPTLLNGVPVEVATEIIVSFPPN